MHCVIHNHWQERKTEQKIKKHLKWMCVCVLSNIWTILRNSNGSGAACQAIFQLCYKHGIQNFLSSICHLPFNEVCYCSLILLHLLFFTQRGILEAFVQMPSKCFLCQYYMHTFSHTKQILLPFLETSSDQKTKLFVLYS